MGSAECITVLLYGQMRVSPTLLRFWLIAKIIISPIKVIYSLRLK